MTTAPVIFTIFNRPDTTRQVFGRLGLQSPETPGSRGRAQGGQAWEAEKCIATREIIDEGRLGLRSRGRIFRDELGLQSTVRLWHHLGIHPRR